MGSHWRKTVKTSSWDINFAFPARLLGSDEGMHVWGHRPVVPCIGQNHWAVIARTYSLFLPSQTQCSSCKYRNEVVILYQDSLSPYGQCVGAIMYEHPSLSLCLIQVYSSFWTKITSGSVITYAGLGHLNLEITFLSSPQIQPSSGKGKSISCPHCTNGYHVSQRRAGC